MNTALSAAANAAIAQVDPSGLTPHEVRVKAAAALQYSADRLRAMDPVFCEALDYVIEELKSLGPKD